MVWVTEYQHANGKSEVVCLHASRDAAMRRTFNEWTLAPGGKVWTAPGDEAGDVMVLRQMEVGP